eukprot:jgi/Mesvir1/11281/Mv01075-RA.2
MSTPITERENELTNEIDAADSKGVVRMMRGCDSQVFAGYRSFPGLADEEIIAKVEVAASIAAEFVAAHKESVVVLSGAGTSGRLACLVAHSFNSVLRKNGYRPIFHYLIAGGEKALFQSQENAEDNPMQGVDDLRQIELQGVRGKPIRRLLLVGISCGLSASYVGSQVMYALGQPHYAVILMGCNPAEQARDVPVEGWPFTMRDVLYQMHLAPANSCFVLNPVVGPEAIMGSTRLKGGTVTKVLLETIFSLACASALKLPFIGRPFRFGGPSVSAGDASTTTAGAAQPPMETPGEAVVRAIRAFQGVYAASYTNVTGLAAAIKAGADALRKGGHIYYAGVGTEGFTSVIDASEQVPTFGARLTDVQGFLLGDWQAIVRQQPAATAAATISATTVIDGATKAATTTPAAPSHANARNGGATPAALSSVPAVSTHAKPSQASSDHHPTTDGPRASARQDANKATLDAAAASHAATAGDVDSSQGAAAPDKGPGYGFRQGASGKETLAPSVAGGSPREEGAGGQGAPGGDVALTNPDFWRLWTEILPVTKPHDLIVVVDSSRCMLAHASHDPEAPDHLPSGPLANQLQLLRSMGDYKRDRGVGSGRLVVVRLIPSAGAPGGAASGPEDGGDVDGSLEGSTGAGAGSGADSLADRVKLRDRVWYASRRLNKFADVVVEVSLPADASLQLVPGCSSFTELAVKYVLNVISTGAHVRVGKVYGSRMVDVRLSNNKLFHRAIGIVAQISGRPLQESREFVLRAIYGEDYVVRK